MTLETLLIIIGTGLMIRLAFVERELRSTHRQLLQGYQINHSLRGMLSKAQTRLERGD